MIEKLLIPVAIGGGLLWLLSSNANAKANSPQQGNPFDVLPANLRIMAETIVRRVNFRVHGQCSNVFWIEDHDVLGVLERFVVSF